MNKIKTRLIIITIACFFLGIIVTWQYKSVIENQKTSSMENVRMEDLKDDLLLEKNKNEDLRSRNAELENRLIELENARGDVNLLERNFKTIVIRLIIICIS